MEGMAVPVKVSFNEELRRFSIIKEASFNQLLERVVQLYGMDGASKVVVKYVDNDGEQVTMSSDAELREALQVSPAVLRVFITVPPAPTLAATPADIEDLSAAANPFYPKWGQGRAAMSPRDFSSFGSTGAPIYFGPHHGHGPHHGGPHHGGPHHPRGPPHHPHGGPHFPPAHGPHHQPAFGGQFPPGPHVQPFHGAGVAFPPPPCGRGHHELSKEQRKEWKKECKGLVKEWKGLSKEERHKLKEERRAMKKLWKNDEPESDARGPKLVARHVKDVTIENFTELLPSTPFVKIWRLRNDGVEAWPAGCRLLWISRRGDRMGAPEDGVTLPETVATSGLPAGADVEISANLTAPAEPGRYTSYWRMVSPDGVKFGQRMWVSIVVTGPSSSSSSGDDSNFGGVVEAIDAMGFQVKKKHIVRLLAKYDGDVDKVVRVLAKLEKGCKGFEKAKAKKCKA